MTSQVLTLVNQQAAFERIKAFEEQIEPDVFPNDLQNIFCRTVSRDEPVTDLHLPMESQKKFVINKSDSQGRQNQAVINEMKNTLLAVKQGKTLAPNEQKYVTRFEKHLKTYEAMQEANPSQTSGSEAIQQSAPEVSEGQEVTTIKEFLQQKKIPPLTPFNQIPNIQRAFDCFFTWSIMASPVIIFGIAAAALTLNVVIAIALVVGLGTFILSLVSILSYEGIKKAINQKAFKKASTPDEILPIYKNLSVEAQAEFLVKLGPKFRDDLLNQSKRWEKWEEEGLKILCNGLTTLSNPKIPLDLKKDTFISLKKRWIAQYPFQPDPESVNFKYYITSFLTHLEKVLIEEKMLTST